MLTGNKRPYALNAYTVEHRPRGWFYKKTYGEDDWHGPYSSEQSVCLMIARALRKEVLKRDEPYRLPE